MIRQMRDADAAVGRGLADVLTALENVIDDEAALGRVYAGLRPSVPAGSPAPRRRLAVGWMAGAAAVLTAGAAALVAVVLPGAVHKGTGASVVSAAYVVKRVDRALSAADPGLIARMTVITRGTTETPTAEEWSYGDQWRSIAYSAAGKASYEEGFSSGSVYTLVSYPTRTWARQYGPGRPADLAPGPRGCEPVITDAPLLFQPGLPGVGPPPSWLPSTVARDLHAAVSCGSLSVAGRQRVDGAEAIELTSRPGSTISETVWVSPGTYLPVRVVARPPGRQSGPWQTADITWLQPTAQNLARLAVPIPVGYRKVPFADAVAPFMQHVRVWTKT
jgi:hypothetical protein